MKVNRKKAQLNSSVDFTPMIDVVFQLILFFLVSTTFIQVPGITVNLPKSSTANDVKLEQIIITVKDEGNIYFNEQKSDFVLLDMSLSEFDTGDILKENYPVILQADGDVKNSTIVRIFDILRHNGFVSISLRTTEY
ncbi:MAG: biopolymer transporter ExbD [Treponema sp.]|nr:biopolymer transporter ExbD [Treponema sp.]